MATENPSLPKGTNDKLAATLAELEAERQRRIEAGQWGRGTLPKLTATPRAGEAWQAAQQRALHEYLAEHPGAPQSVHAYGWMEVEIVDPPPTLEPPGAQYAADHVDAVDVTPPPRRPPPSPPPPSSARSQVSHGGAAAMRAARR